MAISTVVQKWLGRFSGRTSFGGTRRVEPLSPLSLGFCTLRHFRTPLRILDRVFADGGDLKSLDLPGMPPFLFIRDPELIRIVTLETANGGAFDRDTLPTQGIARVVGERNLLYAQGEVWKQHRSAAAKVFGAGAVQTPNVYRDMERTILRAVEPQLDEIEARVRSSPTGVCRMQLDPHVRAVMLNVLVNVLFGSAVPHEELRDRYLPAIENVIRYILIDTVANRLYLPVFRLPSLGGWHRRLKRDRQVFEELVERVIRTRSEGAGFWPLLTSGVPEEAVKSNVRVFLAGALEATASYICWTLSHLARNPAARDRAAAEALASVDLSPEASENASYLRKVLAESLRLNNALYFLPRVAKRAATVSTAKGTL